MCLFRYVFLGIILGHKSIFSLGEYINDLDIFKDILDPMDSDVPLHEELDLWNLRDESDFAQIPKSLEETDIDLDPSISSDFMAGSGFNSCDLERNQQTSKIRTRDWETCPKDQEETSSNKAELPNLDQPNVVYGPEEETPLEYSIPGMGLTINHPKCTHKTFVTHVCCDGPLGPWRAQGYFASVENVGLVRESRYQLKKLIIQPADARCGQM